MDRSELLARTIQVLGVKEGYRFDAAMVVVGSTAIAFSMDGVHAIREDGPLPEPVHFLFMAQPLGGGPMAVAEYQWDGLSLTAVIAEVQDEHEQ